MGTASWIWRFSTTVQFLFCWATETGHSRHRSTIRLPDPKMAWSSNHHPYFWAISMATARLTWFLRDLTFSPCYLAMEMARFDPRRLLTVHLVAAAPWV